MLPGLQLPCQLECIRNSSNPSKGQQVLKAIKSLEQQIKKEEKLT